MQYDRQFHKLSRFAKSLVTTEKDKVKRFVNGLKMSLQKDLSVVELHSHAEALDKALKAEWVREQMGNDQKVRDKRLASQHFQNRQGHKKGKWTFNKDKRNDKHEKGCERCGRNHETKECPLTTGAYFQCGEKGHLIANYPKKMSHPLFHDKNRRATQGQPQKTQGRLYNMTREEASNSSDVVRGSNDNSLY